MPSGHTAGGYLMPPTPGRRAMSLDTSGSFVGAPLFSPDEPGSWDPDSGQMN